MSAAEWVSGTVALAAVRESEGLRMPYTRVHRLNPDSTAGAWADDYGTFYDTDEVTDVRPLVVIDPATVDVGALGRVAWDAWDGRTATESTAEHFADIARAVLAKLGIEAAP